MRRIGFHSSTLEGIFRSIPSSSLPVLAGLGTSFGSANCVPEGLPCSQASDGRKAVNTSSSNQSGLTYLDKSSREAMLPTPENPLLERFKKVFKSGRDGNVFETAEDLPSGQTTNADALKMGNFSAARSSVAAVSSRFTARCRKDGPLTLEGALRDSEEARMILEIEPPCRICYVNPVWEEITGWKEKSVVGSPGFTCLQGPLTATDVLDDISQVIQAYGCADLDVVNYHKNGTLFMNSVHVTQLFNEQGRTTHLLAILHGLSLEKSPSLDGTPSIDGLPDSPH